MTSVLIITRTKDRPELLVRALDSVDQQSFSDYLHLVVNDGGNPDVLDAILAASPNDRRKVIHHPHSLGMEAATNSALRAHQARYVVVHDDDDSWQPEFLSEAVGYLDGHEKETGVVCNIQQVFEKVEEGRVTTLSSRPFNPAVAHFLRDDFFVANQFVPIAFLYRYAVHDEIGLYDERLRVCGDLDFHIRLLQRHSIGKLPGFLANYHIRVATPVPTLSNSVSDKAKHLHFAQQVIEAHDQRTLLQRMCSWWRVRLWYRAKNLLLRFCFRLNQGRASGA
ncbi:glycosyltransferase family 2 protein [Ferrimonas marina]|uniref:glycosyltransferase family 2 protein n=1 Tax=Ferrimonas marina TaxID=299255 RepID=UPI001F1AF963|nr:glycosyltransferase [Ferrimonas marina]